MSKNIDDLLDRVLSSQEFIDALAYQVAQQYQQKLEDDFGNEVTRALAKYVEQTVEKYAKDWQVDEKIKNRVASVFRNIDKDELLKAIVGADWRQL